MPVNFDKSPAVPAPVAKPKLAAVPAPAPTPVPARSVPVQPKPITATEAIANLDLALDHLKTSSNSTLGGTIVYESVQKFEKAIADIKTVVK